MFSWGDAFDFLDDHHCQGAGGAGQDPESFAEIIFGILVIEDILAIILLALLSGFAQTGKVSPGLIGFEVVKLSVFFVMVLVVGFLGVPRLFEYISRFKSNEMLLITALGLCFGIALVASLLGYSVALGAFLIGAVIAESRQIHKIEELVAPVRDMFSAIFFVTIGMLIVPSMLWQYLWPILILVFAGHRRQGGDLQFRRFCRRQGSAHVALRRHGAGAIGEFSFIIATLARRLPWRLTARWSP